MYTVSDLSCIAKASIYRTPGASHNHLRPKFTLSGRTAQFHHPGVHVASQMHEADDLRSAVFACRRKEMRYSVDTLLPASPMLI